MADDSEIHVGVSASTRRKIVFVLFALGLTLGDESACVVRVLAVANVCLCLKYRRPLYRVHVHTVFSTKIVPQQYKSARDNAD